MLSRGAWLLGRQVRDGKTAAWCCRGAGELVREEAQGMLGLRGHRILERRGAGRSTRAHAAARSLCAGRSVVGVGVAGSCGRVAGEGEGALAGAGRAAGGSCWRELCWS